MQKPANSENVIDNEFDHSSTDSSSSSPEINIILGPIPDTKSIPEISEDRVFEKECFVSNNYSFCDSYKDSCDSPHEYDGSNFPENENAFSKLFDENVLSIFQWLPKQTLVKCMLVCKRYDLIMY